MTFQPLIVPTHYPHQKDNEFNYLQVGDWECEWSAKDGTRYKILIENGEYSDGTSIPQPYWSVSGIERDGLERRAAWVHDYLYAHSGVVKYLLKLTDNGWMFVNKVFDKKESDYAFYNILRNTPGISLDRADLMFKMVTKFGKGKWDHCCRKNEKTHE